MVNTGHPSRACKLCRARRIKCDETKPHCLKCKKAKRQCPGYRDPFEINLRDETQSTIRKAKAAAAAQKRASTSSRGGAGPHDQQDKETTSSDESPTASPVAARRQQQSQPKQEPSHAAAAAAAAWDSPPASSETSWETKSTSTWSASPHSEVAVLSNNTRSPVDAFHAAVLDFGMPLSASSLEDPTFDFNAAWSLPADSTWTTTSGSALSSPLRSVARSMSSSSFDGALLDFSSTDYSSGGGWGTGDDDGALSPAAAVSPSLQTPLDEQATCFFMSNFVLHISSAQNRCLFSFILPIFEWAGIKDTPFPMAFTAVSLAALAGRPNSRHLLSKSRIYYSTALLQLKEAIKDKEVAKHDSSLATSILLSFYEVSLAQRTYMNIRERCGDLKTNTQQPRRWHAIMRR